MKKGFTLAEIMIVLSVIAVLTVILLPAAKNATPNEKIMKFKKGQEIFKNAISELTTSDKYYLNGDLGTKVNGDLIDGFHEGDYQYFCKSLGDILNAKVVNCNDFGWLDAQIASSKKLVDSLMNREASCLNIVNNYCSKGKLSNKVPIMITADNIIFYEANSKATFGMPNIVNPAIRMFGFDSIAKINFETDTTNYKPICMDIDEPCKGEQPFQFGLRVDGKIILSQRAQQWLEKSIQENN